MLNKLERLGLKLTSRLSSGLTPIILDPFQIILTIWILLLLILEVWLHKVIMMPINTPYLKESLVLSNMMMS